MRRQIFNLAVVWALTGIWHGASWNFLLWGCYFGVILIAEKLFLLKWLRRWPRFLQHFYAMFLVVIGWVLFALTDLGQVGGYLAAMFGLNGAGLANEASFYLLTSNLVLLIIPALASTDWPKRMALSLMLRLKNRTSVSIALQNVFLAAVFLLSVAYLVNSSYNPFLYFRF